MTGRRMLAKDVVEATLLTRELLDGTDVVSFLSAVINNICCPYPRRRPSSSSREDP